MSRMWWLIVPALAGCAADHWSSSNDDLGDASGIVIDEQGDTSDGDEAGSADGSSHSTTNPSADDDDESGGEPPSIKFDLPPLPDAAGFGCGEGGEYEFSYLWVANSPDSTVSKIDTRGVVEVARYRTNAQMSGNPSRTSVNLAGDVAVLNRKGSVIKIATRESDCVDFNQDGSIQTSTGPGDVLNWGDDECVLWSRDFVVLGSPNAGPRALAWDSGDMNASCPGQNARLWVGYLDTVHDAARIVRLDGATGEIVDELSVPHWNDSSDYSPYGGAADAEGNFWILGKYPKSLVQIDADSLGVTQYVNPNPGFAGFYGMTLDRHGHPWAASWSAANLWHLDPESGDWTLEFSSAHTIFRGMAIDRDGYAWVAANSPCGLVQYDVENHQVVSDDIELPDCGTPVGVSVDVDGYVWVVDQGAERAYRVDPETHEAVFVDGLISPYTYSDMTGAGLGLVVFPQG